MDLSEALRSDIGAFDRKSPSVLSEAAVRYRGDGRYFGALIDLSGDAEPAVSSGATWLVKDELEAGWVPAPAEVVQLVGMLPSIVVWDAQLHVCQSAGRLALDKESATKLSLWLKPLLSHERPLLRAWAIDALCHCDAAGGARWADIDALLDRMSADPAASVRARVRNIAKRRKPRTGGAGA